MKSTFAGITAATLSKLIPKDIPVIGRSGGDKKAMNEPMGFNLESYANNSINYFERLVDADGLPVPVEAR